MQNKSAIWLFTILLSLACLYQISFSFVTSGVERDAANRAQLSLDSLKAASDTALTSEEEELAFQKFEQEYLQKMNSEEVYPIFGFTYAYCKQNEINLGLDLQGGMNVTLQVSEKDLVLALSGYSDDPAFRAALDRATEMQRNSQEGFVALFGKAWEEKNGNTGLAAIFHNRDNKDKFPLEATNAEILKTLAEDADAAVSSTEQVLHRRIDGLGVVQPTIQRQAGTGRIVVELPGIKDKERVRKILQGTAKLEFWETFDNGEIYGKLDEANTMLGERFNKRKNGETTSDSTVIDSTAVANDVSDSIAADSVNVAETDTSAEGDLVLDGGENAPEEDSNALVLGDDSLTAMREDFEQNNPLFSVLRPAIYQDPSDQKYYAGKGPTVGYASIYDTAKVNELLERRDVKALFPRKMKFLWAAKAYDEQGQFLQLYAINVTSKDGKAPLEGDVITNARVTSDPLGNPEIAMSMNAEGAKIWKNMTGEAASQTPKKSIAIVLDNLVYSAPRVDGEIAGGSSSIMGQFTVQEAEDLANVLKAGKLPAPARIVEEAVVGPTLGAEAISAGLMSFIIATVLVLIYMIFFYSSAGAVADLALLVNVFFIMGVLASLGATLTLPGIAGIVLTMGMSVDANVLIYERVREEIQAGKGIRLAISDGYKNAYSAILDSNITSLLVGIVLYVFGTGPIKGFATTLNIGILTSLFSAIFITRLLFEWRLTKNATQSFSSRFTENFLQNVALPFVQKRKIFYVISGTLFVVGLGVMAVRGLNYGVDFSGGRSFIVRFDQAYPVGDIAEALSAQFVTEDGEKQVPEVKTYGTSNQVKITTKHMIDSDAENADEEVESKLKAGLSAITGEASDQPSKFEVMSSQKVGPTVADDITWSAILSTIFSLIGMFIYMAFRFKRWQYGLSATLALAHDTFVVVLAFSLFYGFLPFSLEVDQAFIAAILTVIGYSLNDTVVIFDRIREYLGIHKRRDYDATVNDAVNATLRRTINTSSTVLLVLLVIFFFGGDSMRGFIFAMIVGIISGTYSTVCIAAPIMVDLQPKKQG